MRCQRRSLPTLASPFLAAEQLAAGALTFRELRRLHSAIYPGVWAPSGVELTAVDRARAAWLWSRRRGVVAGLSASATLGAKWIEPELPAELIHTNRRAPPSMVVRADELACGETQLKRAMPITTPARTAFDLGRRLALKAGVQRIDALMNATILAVVDIEAVAERHPGVRGLRQLRQTLELVGGGAESPYETLTRLLLIEAGFPRPHRVGVDFDGAHHWTDLDQRHRDVQRYARLPELGWIDVRLTSGMLHNNPRPFLDRVGAALLARGCPKWW